MKGEKRIGRKYKKVVYREYTNAQFTEMKIRTEDQKHLGILGPMIHAEVGDRIEVTFKNNATGKKFSMHPHGLYYRCVRSRPFLSCLPYFSEAAWLNESL